VPPVAVTACCAAYPVPTVAVAGLSEVVVIESAAYAGENPSRTTSMSQANKCGVPTRLRDVLLELLVRISGSEAIEFPARISILASWPPSIVHPIASVRAFSSSFPSRAIPAAEEGDQLCLVRARKTKKCLIPSGFSDTYPCPPSFDLFASPPRALSGQQGQRGDPPQHASE
jgi:hypothetical protein